VKTYNTNLINKEFLDTILIKKKFIERKPDVTYETNNVIFKNYTIYGFQGDGKTTTINSIASEAIKRYGAENVNAVVSETGNLEGLMKWGLKPKLINLLFADNATLRPFDKNTLGNYFRIRHIFKQRFNMSNGYILSIIALHRFHAIPIELRTTLDGILVKNTSLNPYDKAVLKKFMGEENLVFFEELAGKRDEKPDLKSLFYFVSKGMNGLVSLPQAKEDCLKNYLDINSILKDMKM
jgi:hypothetical protein